MSDNELLKIELLKACGGDVEAAALAFEWVRPTAAPFAHLAMPATKKAVRIRGRNNQNGGPVDIILELPISQTEIEVPT